MTATDPTPAVERAAESLVLQEGTLDWSFLSEPLREAPRDQVREILTAALTDPDDPDWLARTLYTCDVTGRLGITPKYALRLWPLALGKATRDHWRAVADGLRATITGSGA